MELLVYRVEFLASEAKACGGDRMEMFEDLEMEFVR
jgi:hypothetical protein